MIKVEEAEQIEVNGKTLKEWALTEPHRLESMVEHELDDDRREAMTTVYRIHVLN